MASLPSNTFMFNYNAREYNSSTYTFPKTPGQQFDEDLVLVRYPGPFDGESVNFTSESWMGKDYGTSENNPFSRSSSNTTFTFVYKTSGFTEGNQNLFANRSSGYNYMVRGNMFHTSQSGFLSLTPSTDPQIVFIRIQANGQSERKVVDANGNVLQSVSASSISWGGTSYAVGFFSGYGDRGVECFNDRFYWMYCSLEALTDEEIKKVIAYNENISTFETDITAITATYDSTTSSVTLTAEEDMVWTASTSNDWITLSTTGGTGSSVFTISLSENKIHSPRTGEVILTNGEDVIEITVDQAKHPLFIPFENIYRADLEVIKGYRSGSTINKAYRSGELIYYKLDYSQPTPPDYRSMPLTFKVISGGTISWRANSSAYTKEIQYSINDGTWVSITSTTAGTPISLNTGDIVKFKGDGAISTSSSYINRFRDGTIVFEVYGNIMSLIDSTGYATATTAPDHSFRDLFEIQTGLTSAENLVLPATTIGTNVYKRTFSGCTSLTTAPSVLPATVLTESCYSEMFKGCTGLTSTPSLQATTMAKQCCYGMFAGCTSLTSAPELPATTLAQYCYTYMFSGCTSLTTAPSILPATTLVNNCYQYMFSGCTSLTSAPELPATTLATSCYSSMFRGCTHLTTAPELPAPTLTGSCYSSMFNGCASLNYIKCLATDISAGGINSWVSGVSSTGTFVKDANMEDWTTGASGIPENWVVEDDKSYEDEYLTFNILTGGTIVWKAQSTAYTTTIEYSKDNGETWTSITSNIGISAPSISVSAGDVIQFRGDNATYATGTTKYNTFSGSTALFNVEGNIMSLIDSTGFATATTLASSYTFLNLFRNCTGLTSAENLVLPATTLASNCYRQMFQGCTSLTTAPALPATTLADYCYYYMFYGCTGLTAAPTLPATTLASNCYQNMFYGCTSLTTAPALPATALAESCYRQMFNGCTSLTTAPALPATTLASNCYQRMFDGCTSLTIASELPATILAQSCYNSMFRDCTSLTTAPELPATTLTPDCYDGMFTGCTSLSYIKCLATDISAGSCTYNWVDGVSSTGTFVTPSSTNWTTGTSGIPSGWTRVDA